MERKSKNSLIILVLVFLVAVAWAIMHFFIFSGKFKAKNQQLKTLRESNSQYDTVSLNAQLDTLRKKFTALDSLLAMRKYNIPKDVHQSKFYSFLAAQTPGLSDLSYVNMEYLGRLMDGSFIVHKYKLSGQASFNELWRLIYAIEESKELKKVSTVTFSQNVVFDEDKSPYYFVNFSFEVKVYTSTDDRFTSTKFTENNLKAANIYNIFYPKVRTEIEPNIYDLLDVKNSKLLALLPDGAFLMDERGRTYVLAEGDEVYLGFLTRIDRESNSVTFVLNKGGVIETVTIRLLQESDHSQQQETKR
ncbi:MAG: hypothetical protein J0L60_00035 [Ignavibacteria bacterium]|nr:hypothetical protein [Ignavibacteria bacterium]